MTGVRCGGVRGSNPLPALSHRPWSSGRRVADRRFSLPVVITHSCRGPPVRDAVRTSTDQQCDCTVSLGSTLSRAEVACAQRRPRHPLEGGEVMETFRNTGAPDLTIRHVAQAVDLYERAFGAEEIDLLRLGGPLGSPCSRLAYVPLAAALRYALVPSAYTVSRRRTSRSGTGSSTLDSPKPRTSTSMNPASSSSSTSVSAS
jgi:hypothetical protein